MTQQTDKLNAHIDRLELELAELQDVADAMEEDMDQLQAIVDKPFTMAESCIRKALLDKDFLKEFAKAFANTTLPSCIPGCFSDGP